MLTWLLASIHIAGANDPSCWLGAVNADMCCDMGHGPQGNIMCWDDVFTFDRCCGDGDDSVLKSGSYGKQLVSLAEIAQRGESSAAAAAAAVEVDDAADQHGATQNVFQTCLDALARHEYQYILA
eukprot:TRINITY_DN19628_c0_g1_i1.p1 TRINITY_DN19628_c0_g1~~TRINITY_DN19628_c0_g1_i1.p1  ORF type:complete len:125 (-),score=22.94 TRINITY_DN19628_c0_g1_i1:8-382(-)